MLYHEDMGNQQPKTLTSEARRRKQQALMVALVERKIRTRAQQIYEERGQVDGFAVADWVQAEKEVLEQSILAPLYWRFRTKSQEFEEFVSAPLVEMGTSDPAVSEPRT